MTVRSHNHKQLYPVGLVVQFRHFERLSYAPFWIYEQSTASEKPVTSLVEEGRPLGVAPQNAFSLSFRHLTQSPDRCEAQNIPHGTTAERTTQDWFSLHHFDKPSMSDSKPTAEISERHVEECRPRFFGRLLKAEPERALLDDLTRMNETALDPVVVKRIERRVDLLVIPALAVCYMVSLPNHFL